MGIIKYQTARRVIGSSLKHSDSPPSPCQLLLLPFPIFVHLPSLPPPPPRTPNNDIPFPSPIIMAPTIPSPPTLSIHASLQYHLHRRFQLPKKCNILRPHLLSLSSIPGLDLLRSIISTATAASRDRESFIDKRFTPAGSKSKQRATRRLLWSPQLGIQKHERIQIEAVRLIDIRAARRRVEIHGRFTAQRPGFDTWKDEVAAPGRAVAGHQEADCHDAWRWREGRGEGRLREVVRCVLCAEVG